MPPARTKRSPSKKLGRAVRRTLGTAALVGAATLGGFKAKKFIEPRWEGIELQNRYASIEAARPTIARFPQDFHSVIQTYRLQGKEEQLFKDLDYVVREIRNANQSNWLEEIRMNDIYNARLRETSGDSKLAPAELVAVKAARKDIADFLESYSTKANAFSKKKARELGTIVGGMSGVLLLGMGYGLYRLLSRSRGSTVPLGSRTKSALLRPVRAIQYSTKRRLPPEVVANVLHGHVAQLKWGKGKTATLREKGGMVQVLVEYNTGWGERLKPIETLFYSSNGKLVKRVPWK